MAPVRTHTLPKGVQEFWVLLWPRCRWTLTTERAADRTAS